MSCKAYQRRRWWIRVLNVCWITGLIFLIIYNVHPLPVWLIVLLSIMGVMILWGGRIWCGYICPVGLTLDALWVLNKKLKVRSIKRSEKFNRFIRWFKYFFLVFYTVLHFVLGIDPGWFLVVLLVVTAPFLVRFWCSFCPVGTVLGWLNAISPLKLKKESSKCVYCSSCSKACPMQSKKVFKQQRSGLIRSNECILCGECISKCPKGGAISLTFFNKTLCTSQRRAKDPVKK